MTGARAVQWPVAVVVVVTRSDGPDKNHGEKREHEDLNSSKHCFFMCVRACGWQVGGGAGQTTRQISFKARLIFTE